MTNLHFDYKESIFELYRIRERRIVEILRSVNAKRNTLIRWGAIATCALGGNVALATASGARHHRTPNAGLVRLINKDSAQEAEEVLAHYRSAPPNRKFDRYYKTLRGVEIQYYYNAHSNISGKKADYLITAVFRGNHALAADNIVSLGLAESEG